MTPRPERGLAKSLKSGSQAAAGCRTSRPSSRIRPSSWPGPEVERYCNMENLVLQCGFWELDCAHGASRPGRGFVPRCASRGPLCLRRLLKGLPKAECPRSGFVLQSRIRSDDFQCWTALRHVVQMHSLLDLFTLQSCSSAADMTSGAQDA